MLDPNPNEDAAARGDYANMSEADEVTATVISGAQPASDAPTVAEFMSAVVAWPGSAQDPGFVNLHYSMTNPNPTPDKPLIKGMGWPYREVDKLVSRAAWVNTVPDKFKDLWFCTSRQSVSGVNKRGNPKAVRLAQNATWVKSIWIDVDVGPSEPGKKPKYATVEDALKAILLFAKTVGLPAPSAIVFSGGGIHVYWISKNALTPAEWLPYASGLKDLLLADNILCDTGLTTDIARILRVPGTLNYKYDPPKPVTLAPLPLVLHDFAKLDFLKAHAGTIAPGPSKPTYNPFAEGAQPFTKMHPAFAVLKGEPDLNAGIKNEQALLDPRPIFTKCGFYREALKSGGAQYDQLLWMLSILGTTFMENGNDIAHKISSGHSTYSPADTQAMFDRKVAERADGRVGGYPQCATIAGAGCGACKMCPHFKEGK